MSHGFQRKLNRRKAAAARCIEEKFKTLQNKKTYSIIVPKREVNHIAEVRTLKTPQFSH